MKNDFNMCPMCGSKNIKWTDGKKWLCPDCGFDLYCNIAAAVGIVLYDNYNNVLFEVRAKDPRKGFLCLPGGFVDAGESAEQAVERECREELSADIHQDEIKYLCSFPNIYEYKKIEYKTCDIFFAAKLPQTYADMNAFVSTLHGEESEVTGLVIRRIKTAEDVEALPLAFGSAKQTLLKWVNIQEHL